MNSDVPIVNWKRITKGLPSGKTAANDRAPTIEEIKKLVEYQIEESSQSFILKL
jgi:hypothetical protein